MASTEGTAAVEEVEHDENEEVPETETEMVEEEVSPGLVWKFVTEENIRELDQHDDLIMLQNAMNEMFDFTETLYTSRVTAAKSDILFHSYRFAKQSKFTMEKTSACLGIVASVLDFALTMKVPENEDGEAKASNVDPSFEELSTTKEAGKLGLPCLRATFDHFRKLLLQHSVVDSEDCVALFTVDDVSAIANFLKVHFLVALDAHQALLYHTNEREEVSVDVMVEEPFPVDFILDNGVEVELDEESKSKYARALALRRAAEPVKCPLLDQIQETAGIAVVVDKDRLDPLPENLKAIAEQLAGMEIRNFHQSESEVQ